MSTPHTPSQALRRAGELAWRAVLVLSMRARRTWSRSLQVRMVTITVLASGLLVGIFGYVVGQRHNAALIEGARTDASVKLDRGAAYLKEQLASWENGEAPGTDEHIAQKLAVLAASPQQGDGTIVAVKLSKATGAASLDPLVVAPRSALGVAGAAISAELQDRVANHGMVSHQVVVVDANTYLVYGQPVPTAWNGYPQVELYYLVPLNTEVGVALDSQRTIIIVGAALVLFLTILVVLVTRIVTQPVRLAAQTAQRLSAGLLDERMDVKGEDELALLADAFNQMAANLQRQIVRLEEMSRLQRRFTSDVSHELRTPLTTVRMAADLIHAEREGFDPAVARSAELLQTELDRFEELLTDLLEISRFDAGFAALDGEPTDLVGLVQRVVDRLRPVAKRAGVKLTLKAPKPPVIAEVDARRVERILRNLVDNAIDHGEGRPVVITLGANENAVAITVRDHGVGLRAGEEKLVFNRFWRADPSRARQTGGTGLGLSISVEDARLHGGWLEATGEPGKGALFRLTVPIRAGSRLTGSPLPLALPTIPAQAGPVEVVPA